MQLMGLGMPISHFMRRFWDIDGPAQKRPNGIGQRKACVEVVLKLEITLVYDVSSLTVLVRTMVA